ncbi:MAG: 2-oxoacid:ferredoxin oxidoreductase subunit gamma [Syntrophobacterales bacterium CG_4_8_14_3_um_filter_58_8]|nr:MAG: 2-oxoacid:ferredoxin oxidoreductase subunit gamma [Syntrophaceae bacterium CG2_30_58_14]PIV00077.1 MAG: 2-oxoacid:ferredoxin oxidoreductase subunit gamma [Syntrophobacterales bacterium CG03_land_8_20_14_0_80_58_14]PJC76277.1 MAG: 2-oxoacid:ferredoxin oxidoreductase subunit gamma [Syntrophobacterales bacterium CG_4_8_14_3_um_filter_58_8]
MLVKTILCGFGGQGVLMMGYTLAHGAMNAGYHVTYLPSYGAEVRGGTANCTVAVSDDEIASPIASAPDHIVALNTPSLYTFQNRVAPGGALFLNSSIIAVEPSRRDVRVFKIPSSEMAEKLGNPRTANTVMMGAFLKITGLVPPDIYLRGMETVMGSKKKSVIEINRRAFAAGYEFLEKAE